MAGKSGAFLKFVVIASFLPWSGRADAQTHLEQARLAAEQPPPEQNQSAGQTAAAGYQSCLGDAGAAHDASWATECKRIGEKDRRDYDNCISKLNLPKSYCDASYALHDSSPTCTLPGAVASVIDAELERARYRCLRDKEAASQ